MARVSPEKSIGLLLKASVLVHARFPGVQFDVIGGGAALEDTKLLASCLGARVNFRGPVYAELPQVRHVRAQQHRFCGAMVDPVPRSSLVVPQV